MHTTFALFISCFIRLLIGLITDEGCMLGYLKFHTYVPFDTYLWVS